MFGIVKFGRLCHGKGTGLLIWDVSKRNIRISKSSNMLSKFDFKVRKCNRCIFRENSNTLFRFLHQIRDLLIMLELKWILTIISYKSQLQVMLSQNLYQMGSDFHKSTIYCGCATVSQACWRSHNIYYWKKNSPDRPLDIS